MNDAHECHRKAEALATLAMMFPESADRYREKERHWRTLEAQALASRPAGTNDRHKDSSTERDRES